MTWIHDELADDLAAHLRGEATMVWTNIQLGPSGSPRPDVYTLAKSFSHPNPRAYEVKVSVADFRADVTAGKWQSYLAYSGSVTFAVPAGLVAAADVPPQAGLIVRGEAGWRAMRRPTPRAIEIPEAALLKLLIDGIEREGGRLRARDYYEARKGVDRFCKKFGADAARWVKARGEAEDALRSAELNAERIVADARRTAERTAKEILQEVPAVWRSLTEALGLAENASVWTVRAEARRVSEAAKGWGQPIALTNMRSALERAIHCADELIEASKPKREEGAA